jgi:hypothetical protein
LWLNSCRNLPLLRVRETRTRSKRFLSEVNLLSLGGNMSLRDFNNTPFPDDPTALHNRPVGNESGLGNFHTVQPEDIEPNNTPKIVGAIAVALMVGAAGVALYTSQGSSPSQSKQMVAAAPAPTMPVNTPPAAAPLPDASMPASAPVAAPEPVKSAATEPAAPKSAPIKSAGIAKSSRSGSADTSSTPASDAMAARLAAANEANQVNTQPQQQAAVTPSAPAPEQPAANPVGPSPSPSDLATNNIQSGVAVPQGAASASDIPTPAPAQGANPIPEPTPEPTQPSAQPSGQIAQ